VRIVIIKGYARRYRAECARRWGPSVAVGPAAAAPGRSTLISYLPPWRIL
jgi:hypothetical protein